MQQKQSKWLRVEPAGGVGREGGTGRTMTKAMSMMMAITMAMIPGEGDGDGENIGDNDKRLNTQHIHSYQ